MTSTNTAGNNTAAPDEVQLISLDALNARQHSEEAFEFNYVGPRGNATSIFFSVLGEHSERVRSASNELLNEQRRTAAQREASATSAIEAVEPVEESTVLGQKLAAVRLVGWRGIQEEFTPARALALCQSNSHVAGQVLAQSRRLENFIKV